MKTLYFNIQTLLGEYPNPLSLTVTVPEDFTLTKEVDELDKVVQKENEDGRKIYLKEVYNVTTEDIITGYDETITPNDKPYMVTVQDEDKEGNVLFTEIIYDEEGVEVDTMTTTKSHNENGEANKPIMKEVQKTTNTGKLLYLVPIIEVIEHKEFSHYEEVTEETDKPCMINVMKKVTKDIWTDREAFNINEVLQAKYINVLDNSQYDYIVADMFLNEEDLDLEKSYANTGVGLVQLPPKGYVTTKPIDLVQESNTFKVVELDPLPKEVTMYINARKVVDGQVVLATNTNKLSVKFYNPTNKYINIKSYTILY